MFEVELDIFSGRPNPRWTLTATEEAELLTRLLDRSVPIAPMTITDGKLGYRGFLVRATGSTATALETRGLPTGFRVRDGLGATDRPGVRALAAVHRGTWPRRAGHGFRQPGPVHRGSLQEALPQQLDGLQRLERLVGLGQQLLQLRLELAHRHVRTARPRLRDSGSTT